MFSTSKFLVNPPSTVVTDPYFRYTTLLLNDTGTNGAQNNTFIDSSTNNFTITRNGNTTQGSFNPYMPTGYWGAFFDGVGDYLTAPNNTAFDFGSGNFTIECWVYSSTGYGGVLFGKRANILTNSGPFQLGFNTGNVVQFLIANNSAGWAINSQSTTALQVGVWNHLALTRNGSSFTVWLNGASIATGTNSSALLVTTDAVSIGAAAADGGASFNSGYISNVRIVKGTAVYTSAFTPPTSPLTAITNTSLLCLQDNRFKDNSSNNFTITRNGDTKVTHFNPFAPPASYTTSAYGGSAYFDGSSDYLALPNNAAFDFGSGNFTVEGWFYPPSTISSTQMLAGSWDGTFTLSWYVVVSANNVITLETTTNGSYGSGILLSSATNTVKPAQWNHFAVVRNGTSFNIYLNGVSVASTTSSTSIYSYPQATKIGGNTNNQWFNGYISNLRIVKGTAVYTAAFTPPTAPVTAISGTSLLLNATNAGIYDATVLNDLETVNTAQVSTAQSKWGSGSIYFNGSSYLTFPSSQLFDFKNRSFTIEGWFYIPGTGTSGFQTILYKRSGGGTGIAVSLSYSASSYYQWLWIDGNYIFPANSGAAIPKNQWVHLAWVRNGSSFTTYINGVLNLSATNAISVATNTANLMIGGEPNYSQWFTGYVDDYRITMDVARYTANFTPPTAAFPTR